MVKIGVGYNPGAFDLECKCRLQPGRYVLAFFCYELIVLDDAVCPPTAPIAGDKAVTV